MSKIDLPVILLQILVPLALLLWLYIAPGKSVALYLAQIVTIALYLLALFFIPMWLIPPWWMPWVYVAAGIMMLVVQGLRGTPTARPRLPSKRSGWLALIFLTMAAIFLTWANIDAISGRAAPQNTVDLAFPMGPGTYLVASGGSTATVNAHFKTLEPQTDRQRAYRGQSYAIDLIKFSRFGFRARGWRPLKPSAYAIFGELVLAPCSGSVLSARNDLPDMIVPQRDESLLEGNHVFIDCGEFGVLLAHLRQGSVVVSKGDPVSTGQIIGEAGNSGMTGEPHLHIHAQRIPASGPLLSGEPLFITLDGRFLARNDRLQIDSFPGE